MIKGFNKSTLKEKIIKEKDKKQSLSFKKISKIDNVGKIMKFGF